MTAARAAKALFLFVGIFAMLWVGWCMVLGVIGDATHSGVGSCGPYGDAAGLIVLLGLFGFLSSVPASVYLTRRALRPRPPG